MRIYLDYNSTTPVDRVVLDAMLPYFADTFGNASSIHSAGQHGRSAVDAARESVARLIGAKPAEIVFTSGGTEADNLALFGAVTASNYARKHIITTTIEHHAVLNAAQALQKQSVDVTYVPIGSSGIVNPEDVRRALRPETILISVMHANNEIGTIQPLEEIGRIAAEADVYLHCDAIQSAGKLPLDVNRLRVDLLSLSAHKIYGPKGVGALYVRTGTPIEPQFHGGHHERDRRPGTENVSGIVGLGKAAELASSALMNLVPAAEQFAEEGEFCASGVKTPEEGPRVMSELKLPPSKLQASSANSEPERIAALRDRLEEALISSLPAVRVNGDRARRVPNTSNLTFASAAGEALVIALDLQGIACSTGAACSSGAIEPSHVLLAMGLSPEDARSSLRFSLGRPTTSDEIDHAISVIPTVVERLRALSPFSASAVHAQ